MNRKILFIIALLVLNTFLLAGTAVWEEGFDGDEGWSLEGNWRIADSQLRFYWSPQAEDFDHSSISYEISLPENVGDLQITHSLDDYSCEDEVAEISVIASGESHILWSYDIENGDISDQELSLSLVEFAGETVQLKFRVSGSSSYNLNSWDILDARIFAMLPNDLGVTAFSGPNHLNINSEGTWEVQVKNIGSEDQESYTVNLCNSNNEILSSFQSEEPLLSEESNSMNLYYTPTISEINSIYAEVVLDNDDFEENNRSEFLYLYVGDLNSLNVFVWNNDNGSDYHDYNAGEELDCEVGIEQALADHGVSYTTAVGLPEDLSEFDIVFGTLGLYCLG